VKKARLHETQTVLHAGAVPSEASSAMILLHGRGAPATDILSLHAEFETKTMAYLAPSAVESTWYPNSFLAPLESNQPWLDSALNVIELVMAELENSDIPREKTILLGFSQGACLTLEYAARNAGRFGGVVGLSGGLIGPPGTAFEYDGSLEHTPVFLGCSDIDPHIPVSRVHESASVFERMGGDVTEQIYPGGGHTVFPEEIRYIRQLVETVAS